MELEVQVRVKGKLLTGLSLLQYMKQQLLLFLFKGIKCGKVLRNVFSVYLRKILLESREQMVSNNTSEDYGEM